MLALIFFIAFPFLFISARKKITAARASVTWPSVPGVITASVRGRRMLRQQPQIAYSYAVNGQPLIGNKTTFSGAVLPKETDAYLARYPVGQPVNVFYSPANPAEAVLEPGSDKTLEQQPRILLICFVVLLVVNILQFVVRMQP